MKKYASSSPTGAALLIAVLATAVFGLTTLWYFKSNSKTANTLGYSIAQVVPTTIVVTRPPISYYPTPTIPTLRLYLGQKGKVVCNRGMVLGSRSKDNPHDLYVTCRMPTLTPTKYPYPTCKPWPTCVPGQPCPLYPITDGWCPPYYATPTPRTISIYPTRYLTVYPTRYPSCIVLDCPAPPFGCYYKGGDRCTTCGQIVCPTPYPTRNYWQNAQ